MEAAESVEVSAVVWLSYVAPQGTAVIRRCRQLKWFVCQNPWCGRQAIMSLTQGQDALNKDSSTSHKWQQCRIHYILMRGNIPQRVILPNIQIFLITSPRHRCSVSRSICTVRGSHVRFPAAVTDRDLVINTIRKRLLHTSAHTTALPAAFFDV
jgi:hypothetical protein